MNIFISWSGDLSKLVALALYNWIPAVIQVAKPFMSSEDLGKGKRWPQSYRAHDNSSRQRVGCHGNAPAGPLVIWDAANGNRVRVRGWQSGSGTESAGRSGDWRRQTKKDPEPKPGVSSPDGYSGGKGGAARLKYTRLTPPFGNGSGR